MERATRGSLEAVSDLRDRDARRITDQDVDVIGRVASSDEPTVERARLPLEHCGEPRIEARLEPRDTLARGPDQVDDQDRRGVGMPWDERKERIHRCPFGHIRGDVAGMEISRGGSSLRGR